MPAARRFDHRSAEPDRHRVRCRAVHTGERLDGRPRVEYLKGKRANVGRCETALRLCIDCDGARKFGPDLERGETVARPRADGHGARVDVIGCSGCGGEPYWSEWHNDPPCCNDPCDRCGNWIGPGAAGYRAPYYHEYAPPIQGQPIRVEPAIPQPDVTMAKPVARKPVARKPQQGPRQSYQR